LPLKRQVKVGWRVWGWVNFSVHYESDVVLGFGQILAHKLAHAKRSNQSKSFSVKVLGFFGKP
jgi:hypothetical protein